MLLELFWPKKMKEMVEKYRKEGTLNEEAVSYLKRTTIIYFTVFIVISLLLLFSSDSLLWILVLILSPLFVWIDINRIFKNQIQPYASNNKVTAKFNKVTMYYGGRQRILYRSIDGTKELICKIGAKPRLQKEDYPNKNETVSIFESKKRYGKVMPDIDYLKRKYSLTTKATNSHSYHISTSKIERLLCL